jgi:hypothetical protein
MKRALIPLLAAPMLLEQAPAPGQPPTHAKRQSDRDLAALRDIEDRAIRTMLDGAGPDGQGGKRFVVISGDPGEFPSMSTITAHTLAWFSYSPGDRAAAVSYFLVPWPEKLYTDRFGEKQPHSDGAEYRAFLRRVAGGGSAADMDGVKQMEVQLPDALVDDAWFDELCRIYEYGPYSAPKPAEGGKPRVTSEWMTFGSMGPYYNWGIKTDVVEHVQGRGFRDSNLMRKIKYEILQPIERAILEHETPDEWKEDLYNYLNPVVTSQPEAAGK